MSIQIILPNNNSQMRKGKNLAAYGRSGDGFDRIVGTCVPIPGPGSSSQDTRHTVPGILIELLLVPGNPAQPLSYKWLMVFGGLDIGSYRLKVAASDADGNDALDEVEFKVTDGIQLTLDILDPFSGEDITFERDDFLAYGDTDTPISSTDMTDPDGMPVGLQLFSDPVTLHFWSAMATESLSKSGEYTFIVSDGTTTVTSDNLHVD
jgi:hypothetical protein